MTNVLILGATGSIGTVVRQEFISKTQNHLTLFARHAISKVNSERETAVKGDVLNSTQLDNAMKGQNAVFAALSGDLGSYARSIVSSCERMGVKRLIFISSMGIYNEIPASVGSGNLQSNSMLRPYREAADVIEASNLDYTILRPAWFDNGNANYEVTVKGTPIKGNTIGRKGIADMVLKLVADPTLYARNSIGLNRPQ